jgi:hypothetical protein
MMRVNRIAIPAFILLLVLPLRAHHSFSSEYNITSQIRLKGEITGVEWTNPHVFVTMAVREENGELQQWHVEGGAVSYLNASGWTPELLRQMVRAHETIAITGYLARKNAGPVQGAWGKEIEMTDGRKLPFN